MTLDQLRRYYDSVWMLDFEFAAPDGERPTVACLVARELFSGRLLRLFSDELGGRSPFSIDDRTLFVAFYSSAEWGCFLSLGWALPRRIVDLYVEFRLLTNGLPVPAGRGLLGALAYHGLDSIGADEKQDLRALAMRGGPYTTDERLALLDYCESDVDALGRLFPKMLPALDLPRALLRGRYMAAVARMEHTGVPIDVDMLGRFRESWAGIKDQLIAEVDRRYGCYDGQSFRQERFARWLVANDIPWPLTAQGNWRSTKIHSGSKRGGSPRWPSCGSCAIRCAS